MPLPISAQLCHLRLCHRKIIHPFGWRFWRDLFDLQRRMEYGVVFLSYKICITHVVAQIFLEKWLFQGLFSYSFLLICSHFAYLNVQDVNATMCMMHDYVVLNVKRLELNFFTSKYIHQIASSNPSSFKSDVGPIIKNCHFLFFG